MKRELTFGVYEATSAFRAINSHSCVCYKDDMGLVAVTGPADDKESQKFAELFSAALDLLATLELAQRYLAHPDVLEITKQMALSGEAVNERIADVIAKAKGGQL